MVLVRMGCEAWWRDRITWRKNGLPFIVTLLDWIRHLGAAAGTEEAGEEWDSRHRFVKCCAGQRCLRFVLGCGASGVIAECIERANDGWEIREFHEDL